MQINILRKIKLNYSSYENYNVRRYCVLRAVVAVTDVSRFITDCLVSVNAPKAHAEIVADALAQADYRGHFGHGIIRLEMLLKLVNKKFIDVNAKPEIVVENDSSAVVNGNYGFGHVVSQFCIDLAIKKGKATGFSCVLAKNSHYNRMLAQYSIKAIQQGLISFCMSNTPACMSPEPLKGAILGSNPFSAAAPGLDDDHFLVDMSTTEASFGKIEMTRRKHIPLPFGWAKDKLGRITQNPEDASDAKLLLPTGGDVGFGLAVSFEILCSVLSGGKSMLYIPNEFQNAAKVGHCFFTLNPDYFAPDFKTRLTDFLSSIRGTEPIDPKKPMLVPGDPEHAHMKEVDKAGGITYGHDHLDIFHKLAFVLKVPPIKPNYK